MTDPDLNEISYQSFTGMNHTQCIQIYSHNIFQNYLYKTIN